MLVFDVPGVSCRKPSFAVPAALRNLLTYQNWGEDASSPPFTKGLMRFGRGSRSKAQFKTRYSRYQSSKEIWFQQAHVAEIQPHHLR